jgi:RNA polymerase sigma factor (sigma-70 family)
VTETIFEQSYSTSNVVAGIRAAMIVELHRLPNEDRRDLKQEALLELWRKAALFDARRASWRTFAETVVANRLTSFMRTVHAGRREHGRNESLNEHKRFLPAPDDCFDLRADIQRVLAGVSRFDRAVALSLIDYSSSETSHRLSVSRSTVYRSIERLRAAFTAAGLSSTVLGR